MINTYQGQKHLGDQPKERQFLSF